MMRTVKAFVLALFFLLSSSAFVSSASAAAPTVHMEPKNPDPLSTTYSPVAWQTVWSSGSTARQAIQTADPQAAMEQVGFLVYAGHEQWTALTAADQTQLTTAWKTGQLLDKESKRSTLWSTKAFALVAQHQSIPAWSPADADSVATDLGGTTYAALSPGLKGVVQRIATIVTGDSKPKMPDDVWSSWMSAATKTAFTALPDTKFDWSKVTISVSDPGTVVKKCDAGILNWACKATQAVARVVGGAVDFLKDPLAWITAKAGDGALGVMSWISNTANAATQPDLSAQWWIDAYQKGMAIGIILFGLVLLYQFYEKVRGHITAQEFLEVFYIRVIGYFTGLIFGPPLAQFLLQGSAALASDIIKSWTGSNATDGIKSIKDAITGASEGQLLGGAFVALILLVVVILCGLLVFLSLSVQAVTIYLSSAVFGIAFAWFVSVRHAGGSLKIPFLFVGICFARPLLFFMLGLGEGLVKKAITMSSDTLAQNLATIVMAVTVLALAGLAPLLLLKFAPVAPHGMEAATSSATAHMGGGGQRGGGMTKLGQLAQRTLPGRGGSASGSGGGGGAARTAVNAAAGGGSGGSSGSSGGGMGGGAAGGAVSLTKGSAADTPGSATSRAGRSGGDRSSSTLTGQLLGRSRRHGGGTPSAGAARVAAAKPPASRTSRAVKGAGRAVGATAKAAPGITAGATRSAHKVGHSLAEGVGGDKEW